MDFELNLRTETVTHGCVADPVTLPSTTSIRQVLAALRENNTGAALLCGDDGKLNGIFTERDALRLFASQDSLERPVSDVMTADPTTIAESTPIGEAITKMYNGGYRRLPVIDADGKPVGLVKTATLVHYLVDHFPSIVYNLPPNPHHGAQQREGA